MTNYPIAFQARAKSPAGIESSWKSESQNISNICAIPAEFEGPGGGLSPEDLFAQALTNCFIATFKVYAEKSKLQFVDVSVQTELIVDLNEFQKPVMRKCSLNVTITGGEKPERIKIIAEKAFKSGFIINSVKTEMSMKLELL